MGPGGVTGLAFDVDREVVGRSVHRAFGDSEDAHRVVDVQVASEHGGNPVDGAVLDHHPRARPALLGRLEQEADRVGRGRRPKQGRGPQQHGGMAVVAAGMHHPLGLGREGESCLLVDRQGVDVGPQPHHGPGAATVHPGDHAVPSYPGPIGNGELLQDGADETSRQLLPLREFRVPVQFPAHRHDPFQQPDLRPGAFLSAGRIRWI